MPLVCARCGSGEVRTSRPRSSDLLPVIFFLRPVRCRSCLQRYFVSIFAAKKLEREEAAATS